MGDLPPRLVWLRHWWCGCGAGGRWQGQVVRAARLEGGARPAGVEVAATPVVMAARLEGGARPAGVEVAAVPVGGGRARAGLEIEHSERSSRVAISRAGRRPPAHRAAIDNKMRALAARRSGGGVPHGGLAAGCRTEVWRRGAPRGRRAGGKPWEVSAPRPRR